MAEDAGGVSPRIPRTALVTGAARRVGRAIALSLARDGFRVALHCRDSLDEAKAVLDEIETHGGSGTVLQADLAGEAATAALYRQARAAMGPIGVLVNNASVFERDEALDATRESWDAHMEVNLRAPFALIQAMARDLPEDAEGAVVNLLDERVWNITPHFLSYTVSKVGLWGLTQSLALALAPRIRVNGIGPGPALPSPRQTQEQFDRQCAALPLRRGTSPEEIAEAVRFILRTRSLTGQMIALDGGQHLAWRQAPGAPPPVE
ncbi:MAG: SDR family oxidoreductase [Acetobacterales bacterium]